ncbi:D123-domain-containing protein [Dendrothele bispora CBS 962.96]|uniref:D123-domain-containing protein n=1 Tax=Dendrothele bispora (strain CBS 962.96) TaxID=1314807 RepID=A0A4S8MQN9_DENBC|nr:D123-domain-containing protein [Dendrothele bispora CBS 962.96]
MTPSPFPLQSTSYILSFQFSSWYPKFRHVSIKSTIIRPLAQEFHDYMNADGVFVPEGSEDVPVQSTLSDDEDGYESDDEGEELRKFAFPELDKKIRDCIKDYGAVFPKLNFSSPKDASWILPASSPLKCTSPSDIYMLLKSSDFINHDLSPETVFEGCEKSSDSSGYELELVLRKWYPVDRSREMRCFVRNNILIGISQRDTNYYEFLNNPEMRLKIVETVKIFWRTSIQPLWKSSDDYIFDILLTRDLSRAHIVDFNPYAPRTDTLLFTYEELRDLLGHRTDSSSPELRVIDSRAHPSANTNAPANQHNMVPFEALSLSSGRDIEEFADLWEKEIKESIDVE